jgi:uncharacterized protein YbjT (DUF2867 family)
LIPNAGRSVNRNKFFLPFGEARFAPIATEDIGRVAAALLADPAPHAGMSYDLFGPAILDMKEIAEIFSRTLERTITYVLIDSETFVANVKKSKNPDPYLLQHLASLGQVLKEGRPAGMNDLVEQLTGQKPMQMSEYVLKNRSAFE